MPLSVSYRSMAVEMAPTPARAAATWLCPTRPPSRGTATAARMPMITTTSRISIKVNPASLRSISSFRFFIANLRAKVEL